jgi:signal transduction histidine kinase
VVVRPIDDADGRPEQLLAVCRDITDRKQAELAAREEAKLAAFRADIAVEVARGGELGPVLQQLTQVVVHHTDVVLARIWMVETDTPTLRLAATSGLYVNGHGGIMIGEGVIGQVAATKRAHITHNIPEEPAIGDAGWAAREGLTSFAAFPLLFESKVLGVLAVMSRSRLAPGVIREIRLLADAVALVVQRKNAEDERAHLLEEAMNARNAAVAASRAKDDFLAALSHELRTPLNPVLLLASDGAADPELPARVRATFETIRNNVRLEAKLIDDLLDLTRITHGKLELDLKPLDLNVAIREAVQIVSDNLEKGRLKLDLHLADGHAMVMADPTRLHQVFWNILNNAAKFTPAGGKITVQSELLDNKRVLVRITDTGIGMKSEDLKRVFDPFRQIESRKGGLGLGLTISRQLLERQQGTIRALSAGVGQGSTFEIELPLIDVPVDAIGAVGAPESPVKPAPLLVNSEEEKKKKLLLVEDHGPTRNTLRDLLVRRKFEVVVASTVAEAVTRTRENEFDLVISDLGLPDGDGFKLLATLREEAPEIRAVALSGYGTEDDRERSAAAGFVAHLTKPIGIEMLDKTIAGILHSGNGSSR